MGVDELIRNAGSWLSMARETGVAISSRVRLARNVEGIPFPGHADEEACEGLWTAACSALRGGSVTPPPLCFGMADLDPVDREVLKERHLVSTELACKGRGSGVVVSRDERLAVMVNEEDHLRIQCMCPGMHLRDVWQAADALDSALEGRLRYSFSPRLGYLTACPTNVGTGLRASVMVHLAGLRLLDEVDPVINGLEKIGLTVRGLLGEGTEAYGNMFQISNQATLGESEGAIVERLERVVGEVIVHEQNARARLMARKRITVLDEVWRSYGLLSHAWVLPSKEAMDLLSGLRLGIELDLLSGLTVAHINEILILTQPGHLQKMSHTHLTPEKRDEMRAGAVRQRLENVTLSGP